jgi:hypothetical protein
MKKQLVFFIVLISTFCFSQNSNEIVIKNVNLISMINNKISKDRTVVLKDGKIVQIDDFKKIKINSNATIIDGKNQFLMTALVDMHVHLPVENEIESLLSLNIAAGVTRIRIMNSEVSQIQVKENLSKKPNLISPFLYYSQIIKKENKYSEKQFDSIMLQMKKNNLRFIKAFGVADEATFDKLMSSSKKNNIIVCGHYPTKIPIEKVLNSGFRSIEHVGGLDAISDSIKLIEAIALSQKNQTFHCPTLDYDLMAADLEYPDDYKKRLVFQFAPKKLLDKWQTDYSKWISENGSENSLKTKKSYLPTFEKKQRIVKKLNDANCNLLLGSDPGNYYQMNGFNVHEEMLNWSRAGIDNFSILKAATINASKFFNESNQWGTIELGKSADLILLEKNPLEKIENISTVKTTIQNGKIYYKTEILSKI